MPSKSGYSWLLTGVAILLLCASCVSKKRGLRTKEIRQPLRVVRKAVEYALIKSILRKSENTRIYFSKYHEPGQDLSKRPKGNLKRAQVIIGILGDKRPYIVEVAYRIESYSNGKYRIKGYDKRQAKVYLELVEEYLASRREGVDMIDGFRPY
ncbi:MAG: hypothetical protein HRT44_05300 [Bdellovibrionales bacterium]|nr:hypothetical protein [Bdellovibrionales bacterium]NQZ18658.1 hypothetical protein [Bdellovibrionales bacterium]